MGWVDAGSLAVDVIHPCSRDHRLVLFKTLCQVLMLPAAVTLERVLK